LKRISQWPKRFNALFARPALLKRYVKQSAQAAPHAHHKRHAHNSQDAQSQSHAQDASPRSSLTETWMISQI